MFSAKSHFEQWDKQVNIPQQAWIELNNLYLAIEAGRAKMSITNSNRLNTLAALAFPKCERMLNYWHDEFCKLPNWFDF